MNFNSFLRQKLYSFNSKFTGVIRLENKEVITISQQVLHAYWIMFLLLEFSNAYWLGNAGKLGVFDKNDP